MPAVTEKLRDAQALAEFSNLELKDVESFRRNYPDFVPQSWWDYEPTIENSKGDAVPTHKKQWQENQRYLRQAWKDHFPEAFFFTARLILSVFDPDQLMDIVMFPQLGHRPHIVDDGALGCELYPHQKAVLYLHQEPWRARFCAECEKRFVAAESKNKYCGEACFHKNRDRQKRKWWAENGSKLRAAQQKKMKRSPRTKVR